MNDSNTDAARLGHWIPVDDLMDIFHCSECGAMCDKQYYYCPGCGTKMDLTEQTVEYVIDEVWPVSTDLFPKGGIGIEWGGPIGFGQLELYWGDDDKVHAYTECLGREFLRMMLQLLAHHLADEIVIDD